MRSNAPLAALAAVALALLAGPAAAKPAAAPPDGTSALPAAWQTQARGFLKEAIEIPTVAHRGQVPAFAEKIAVRLRAAGFPADAIDIRPYEGLPGDKTAALIFRWKAEKPAKKPMLILGHMDVVEAKREDWRDDPFVFAEKDGYFYGRGASDMKNGIVATVTALAKLKAAGFKPRRDIVLFLTGDEETMQNGALLGTTTWRKDLDAEFALNADGWGGGFDAKGRPLGFSLSAAEKTYQSYFLTVRNRGGHSSRPRPDNAIYELATALKKLEAHRFAPQLNPTTRAYFQARQAQEKGALGDAMRRWLADPNDGAAADAIEADEVEAGRTRTRCVATMLAAGHADNALPQMARATVNCRIMPGVEPVTVQAELQALLGAGVEITPDPAFIGRPTPVLPIREDVLAAYTQAVRAIHGPSMPIIPTMDTGTTDASFFRAIGVPAYGVDGGWGVVPDDERAHGLDERIPVRALYDDVLHWEIMVRALAK
ncbi:MAG: M20/M25/M40 family metallo-hydrolase [Alphaproteobacteria bacterium]|nr:M20/M25/M40 family metallo-hydrolase [Alphaproteobacteria bacterium]